MIDNDIVALLMQDMPGLRTVCVNESWHQVFEEQLPPMAFQKMASRGMKDAMAAVSTQSEGEALEKDLFESLPFHSEIQCVEEFGGSAFEAYKTRRKQYEDRKGKGKGKGESDKGKGKSKGRGKGKGKAKGYDARRASHSWDE